MNPITKQKNQLNADAVDITLNVPFYKDPIKVGVSGIVLVGGIILALYLLKKYKVAKKG